MSLSFGKYKKCELNKALKAEGLLGASSMTSAEYKKVINRLHHFGDIDKKATVAKKPKQGFKILGDTTYSYKVDFKSDDVAVITLSGRHFSRNRVNSMSMREKMVYKTRMKDSAKIFFMKYRHIARKCEKWDKVKIFYEIYNPKSRDTNATDLKILRDTFTEHGIIKDDNRNVIPVLPKQKEIISKNYKIVATITRIKNKLEEKSLSLIEDALEICSAKITPAESIEILQKAKELNMSIDMFFCYAIANQLKKD